MWIAIRLVATRLKRLSSKLIAILKPSYAIFPSAGQFFHRMHLLSYFFSSAEFFFSIEVPTGIPRQHIYVVYGSFEGSFKGPPKAPRGASLSGNCTPDFCRNSSKPTNNNWTIVQHRLEKCTSVVREAYGSRHNGTQIENFLRFHSGVMLEGFQGIVH